MKFLANPVLSLPAQVLGFCHHRLREQVLLRGLGESLELCLRQNLEQKRCISVLMVAMADGLEMQGLAGVRRLRDQLR